MRGLYRHLDERIETNKPIAGFNTKLNQYKGKGTVIHTNGSSSDVPITDTQTLYVVIDAVLYTYDFAGANLTAA